MSTVFLGCFKNVLKFFVFLDNNRNLSLLMDAISFRLRCPFIFVFTINTSTLHLDIRSEGKLRPMVAIGCIVL